VNGFLAAMVLVGNPLDQDRVIAFAVLMVSRPVGFTVARAPDFSLHWAGEIGKLRGERSA
jgi:hypothetical protein